jgi:tetratricopeptide (TPR) repeat protein
VRLGQADEAVALAGEAVRLAERTDGFNLRAGALLDRADVLRLFDRDEEAGQDIEKALKLYERKGNIVMAERARRLEETLDRAGMP